MTEICDGAWLQGVDYEAIGRGELVPEFDFSLHTAEVLGAQAPAGASAAGHSRGAGDAETMSAVWDF